MDDDQDDLNFLSTTFRDLAPDVQVVNMVNGIEALNFLETREKEEDLPSLIVLDMNMPFMNGKETLEKIKEHYQLKNLPVVIFTAGTNPNDKEYFKTQGIAMVSKPYSNHRLKEIVNDFLGYL